MRKCPEHPSHPPWLVAYACERPFRGCGKNTFSAIADVHHVMTNWCIRRHPHEEAFLHSVMIRLGCLIVGTALLLSAAVLERKAKESLKYLQRQLPTGRRCSLTVLKAGNSRKQLRGANDGISKCGPVSPACCWQHFAVCLDERPSSQSDPSKEAFASAAGSGRPVQGLARVRRQSETSGHPRVLLPCAGV